VVIQRGPANPERPRDLAHRHVTTLAHRQRRGLLVGGELQPAAAEPAGGLRGPAPGLAALADQLALELGQRGEQMKREPPGVDVLMQRPERDLALPQALPPRLRRHAALRLRVE
jgi:hypothetical protein